MLSVQCLPGKNYVAHFDGYIEKIMSLIFDLDTEELVFGKEFLPNADFVKQIPTLFNKNIKAVTFNVFRCSPSGYSNNLNFCEAIREKLDEMNLMYRFVTHNYYLFTDLLVTANIIPKLGESISFVLICASVFTICNCTFKKDGYEILSCQNLPYAKGEGANALYKNILEASNKCKVIATTTASNHLPVFEILKEKVSKMPNFLAFDFRGLLKSAPHFACEIYNWMIDNTNVKYHIIPTSSRNYFLYRFINGEHKTGKQLVGNGVILPYNTSFIFPRQNLGFFIAYYDEVDKQREIWQELDLNTDRDCHLHQISITVDINSFPTVLSEAMLIPEILALPKELGQNITDKSPVLIFRDTISLICIYNEDEKAYEFLDTWNGKYGRDLYITFDEEKPKYCEDAVEVYNTKPSFVVQDLLCVLSVDRDVLHNSTGASHWGFKITKDIDNPVLLEFDDFDGRRKAGTPILLMAMLLKQHVKAITTKTGKKPKQVTCYYINLYGNQEQVIDSISDAFKLLKIDVSRHTKNNLN